MEEEIQPSQNLDRRVTVFEAEIEGRNEGTVDSDLLRFIGERIVESIYGDLENDTLLIVEKDNENLSSGFNAYASEGKRQGKILAKGAMQGQAEGITLVKEIEGGGYWICTEQGMTENTYHVINRKSLKPLGSFQGRYTLNADGVWFSSQPILPRDPEVIFNAVHNDGNLAAIN